MLWNAHVDWITTTWPNMSDMMGEKERLGLYEWACTRSGLAQADLPLLRWAWQGYIGWQAGQLCWGERPDGAILRVSGDLADKYWTENLPIGHNVSRIDLAVDVWWHVSPDAMIAEHNVDTLDARMLTKSRPWKVACVNGFGDGDTLYIGSRTSLEFIRIYNKEAQSDGEDAYRGATRYEVEYHDEAARAIVHRGRIGRRSKSWLLGEVSSILHRRGVGALSCLLATEPIDTVTRRAPTSDEKKLDWLRTQVAPSVRSLLTRYDEGEILAALGFDVVSRETTKLRT